MIEKNKGYQITFDDANPPAHRGTLHNLGRDFVRYRQDGKQLDGTQVNSFDFKRLNTEPTGPLQPINWELFKATQEIQL